MAGALRDSTLSLLLCRSVTVTGDPDPDAPDLAPDSGVTMTVTATKKRATTIMTA